MSLYFIEHSQVRVHSRANFNAHSHITLSPTSLCPNRVPYLAIFGYRFLKRGSEGRACFAVLRGGEAANEGQTGLLYTDRFTEKQKLKMRQSAGASV
ncbi:hypothetical protein L596_012613 [Steinernema carpocapsae]|uniref:Uncharacterized protein n=1 Tax=Steinernema carpocapsae TaxID=34508 RepID=A0A4U5NXL7_STECR|nr:hypothetical protein L596_012613 [Steinernema carpocapsae]